MRRRGLALILGTWLAGLSAAFIALAQGPNQRNIQVTPSSRQFGSECVEKSSSRESFTITNTASGSGTDSDLHVESITRTGSSDFSFTNPAPITLPSGAHTSFDVTFSPTAHGNRSASFSINSDDPDTPTKDVSVSGSGVDRQLTAARSTVSFGDQRVGTRSPSQGLVVRNPGEDSVTVSLVKKVGANTKDFIVTAPVAPFTIQKGDFRTITIAFQPSGAGIRKAAIEFTSNACAAGTITVSLIGTGIVPDVAVEPTTIDAGTSPTGIQGPSTPVTVSNKGGAPLKVAGIQVTGTNAADFSLSGVPLLPATVIKNDSFVFSLRMTPGGSGLRTATLKVTSDDPDSPTLTVSIRGSGGTATASPTTSQRPSSMPRSTGSPTSSPGPRALGGRPGDTVAVWLVVVGVLGAFAILIVIRRWIVAEDDEE